jgi:hypothetical protein
MELKLIRSVFTENNTWGKIYLNGNFFAYTCEDTCRDLQSDGSGKIKGKTAIACGRYEVVLSYSNRFRRLLPQLLRVKWFEAIRIHGGNTAADSEGCILIGKNGDLKTRIWNCATKVNQLINGMKAIKDKEKIWIEISEQR